MNGHTEARLLMMLHAIESWTEETRARIPTMDAAQRAEAAVALRRMNLALRLGLERAKLTTLKRS